MDDDNDEFKMPQTLHQCKTTPPLDLSPTLVVGNRSSPSAEEFDDKLNGARHGVVVAKHLVFKPLIGTIRNH